MSLRTGTELISLSVLLNKVSGLYGLLAILTGVHLSPLQLSMYIYSIIALVLVAFLTPYIRRQAPLQCLALSWLYIFDTLINAAYTAAFGVTWFMVVSRHEISGGKIPGGGGQMMDDTAGFTNPKYNVTRVDVVATPAAGLTKGQDAVAVGQPGADGSVPSLSHGVLQPESVFSIVVICILWMVRIYFVLVVMAYARSVLRLSAYSTSRTNFYVPTDQSTENPFKEGSSEGQGWKGKLGRAMVTVGKSYWLGNSSTEDENWAQGMGWKFMRNREVQGPVERERRRRSGTGPPPPPPPQPQPLKEVR
ncbi:MAG: hypothetical protein M1819_001244 [Sarea resinae]|nr:MAG: hypothetical protein M1819_001244 [Sarea resinae]